MSLGLGFTPNPKPGDNTHVFLGGAGKQQMNFPYAIPYGKSSIFIYNWITRDMPLLSIAETTATATCEAGTSWNASVCMGGVNLTPSDPTPTTATVGTPQAFTATITNKGTASTEYTFNNLFQVATEANGGGTVSTISVTSRALLAADESGDITSDAYSFTSAGTYSVRVCTDNDASWGGTIAELDENDNCSVWVDIIMIQTPPTPTGLSATPSTCGNNWLNLSWNESV
jgi:hypothetical protein